MTILPVTLTAAAAAAILNIWLMIRIGRIRAAEKISVGDEDNDVGSLLLVFLREKNTREEKAEKQEEAHDL